MGNLVFNYRKANLGVRVISAPYNYLDILAFAAKRCTSSKSDKELYEEIDGMSKDEKFRIVKYCMDCGHHSILEHVSVTISIEGVDRNLSHQLVRHRLCSFSQMSQRYCSTFDKKKRSFTFQYIVPPEIEKNVEMSSNFEKRVKKQFETYADEYLELSNLKNANEISRSLLPSATATSIVVSTNLRNLIHIFNERLCSCAQLPIRNLFKEIKRQLDEVYPEMKPYFASKCVALGYCNEKKRSCGKKMTKEEFLEPGLDYNNDW